MFDQLAVLDAVNRNCFHIEIVARWRYSEDLTLVFANAAKSSDDQVAFCNLKLDYMVTRSCARELFKRVLETGTTRLTRACSPFQECLSTRPGDRTSHAYGVDAFTSLTD